MYGSVYALGGEWLFHINVRTGFVHLNALTLFAIVDTHSLQVYSKQSLTILSQGHFTKVSWWKRPVVWCPAAISETEEHVEMLHACVNAWEHEMIVFDRRGVATCFNPRMQRWRQLAPCTHLRRDGCAVTVGDSVFYMGGWSPRLRICNFLERYDILNDRWTMLAPMLITRSNFTANVLGPTIFIFGGIHKGDGTMSRCAEQYNTVTNTWTRLANMSHPRACHGMAVVDGSIYIMGGRLFDGDFFSDSRMVMKYNQALDSFVPCPSMRNARSCFALGVVGRYIWVFGGTCNFTWRQSVERYDTQLNVWEEITPMPVALRFLRCVVFGPDIVITGEWENCMMMLRFKTETLCWGQLKRVKEDEYCVDGHVTVPVQSSQMLK